MSELEYAEKPWGNYAVLDDAAPDHKVKRLVVHPGKRLSYQLHHRRAEHWFIVSRIANEGDIDVVFIEVQHGSYFGEDDIVRLEDDFGRADVGSTA